MITSKNKLIEKCGSKHLFNFIILSATLLSSCVSYKNLEYGSILSLDELSGIYVDTIGHLQMDNRVSYSLEYVMERDTVDVYEFQFIDNKHLKVSTLTEKGFQETKIYKGKYNKKENYLEISIKKKILPLVILNSYLNEKKRIGKDKNNDLLIDYRYESFGMLIPIGAASYDYQTTSNLVKLKNVQYIPTKLGAKFGYTNPQGDILIEPKYDFVRIFRNNVARVIVNNKWGLIDKKGSYIFEPQFDYISNIYKDSIAYVINNNYKGLIDKKGNKIIPIKGLEITDFYELEDNMYKIYKNKKEGIYNSMTQKYIIEPIYDDIKVEYSKRHNEWASHNIESYFILSLNKEKTVIINDTIVVPPTPKINIYNIYSLDSYPTNKFEYKKISDKIYALNIDFSNTPINLKDIYPFYLKFKNKFYLIDHKNNYYELLSEKETIKMAFKGINPRIYIENNPLTYECLFCSSQSWGRIACD